MFFNPRLKVAKINTDAPLGSPPLIGNEFRDRDQHGWFRGSHLEGGLDIQSGVFTQFALPKVTRSRQIHLKGMAIAGHHFVHHRIGLRGSAQFPFQDVRQADRHVHIVGQGVDRVPVGQFGGFIFANGFVTPPTETVQFHIVGISLQQGLDMDQRFPISTRLDEHVQNLLTQFVAVGFTLVDGVVRVITTDGTQKVRNVERDARATVAQVEGARWLSIAGAARIERDPDAVRVAERLYAERYRTPRENPRRVVIRIDPDRFLASSGLLSR